jgi:putative tryptophan/tyrosine transport system substrate-binding protein
MRVRASASEYRLIRFTWDAIALGCSPAEGGILLRRREFIAGIGGTAALAFGARAQQPVPIVAFVSAWPAAASQRAVAAFRKGLGEIGYVEDRNVTVEYHWVDNQFDRLSALMADLVRRRVAAIATPSNILTTTAAKAATATIPIPIVFSVPIDPVKTGLVASFARPGGNATGIHYLALELAAKQLALLHALAPKATRVAILVNPANGPNADETLRSVGDAARTIGLQTKVLNASTSGEINAAFARLAHDRGDDVYAKDVLFVSGDALFQSRSQQLVALTARDRIPAAYPDRATVAAGGLMTYGADIFEMYRQVGVYAGSILKGAKPADLPVQQSTKFVFVINCKTAKALGLDIPLMLRVAATELID